MSVLSTSTEDCVLNLVKRIHLAVVLDSEGDSEVALFRENGSRLLLDESFKFLLNEVVVATNHKRHILADIRHCIADEEANTHEHNHKSDEYVEFDIVISPLEGAKCEAEHSHVREDRHRRYNINDESPHSNVVS